VHLPETNCCTEISLCPFLFFFKFAHLCPVDAMCVMEDLDGERSSNYRFKFSGPTAERKAGRPLSRLHPTRVAKVSARAVRYRLSDLADWVNRRIRLNTSQSAASR